MTPVRLRLLWHPQAQFAGYLVAQYDGPAAERDLALECVPVDFSLGPIDAVLTGDCEFAVASPAHLIESRAPHDLVMLLAIQQTSSLVYGARRDVGIARAADLVARKIAVWPGGEDLELRWMLHRAGVPTGAATLVPVLDTVGALLDDKVACAQMTTYHEVFELEHRAHSLEPYRLLAAAENDASLLKDGLFARRDWVAAHRETAQRVVDAVLDGWTRAFAAPEAAIDRCVALRPDLSRAHQAAQLEGIRALAMTGATVTHGLGYPDARHVDAALRAVREVEGRTVAGQGADFVDASLWEAAPAAFRPTSV